MVPGFAVEGLKVLPVISDGFPEAKIATGSPWSKADAKDLGEAGKNNAEATALGYL